MVRSLTISSYLSLGIIISSPKTLVLPLPTLILSSCSFPDKTEIAHKAKIRLWIGKVRAVPCVAYFLKERYDQVSGETSFRM